MIYTIDSELLHWLEEHPGLYGYDALTSVSVDQLNTALEKEHRVRLSTESVLVDISGRVDGEGANIAYYLAGYQMAAPSLDMPTDTRFLITGQLDSGMQLQTRQAVVESVSQHDALDPLPLSFNMPFNSAISPSRLQLDVAQGVDMRLGSGDDEQNERGGKFLQALMQEHAHLNEPYVLLGMGQHADSAMDMKHIDLRVQNDSKGERRDLLLWGATQQGRVGVIPNDAHVPGLDPDVNTNVISAPLLYRTSYGQGLSKLLEDGEFAERRDSNDMLVGLDATAGHLAVPPSKYQSAEFAFMCEAFTVPAAGTLSVDFEKDRVDQTWKSQCTVDLRYDPLQGEGPRAFQATFQLNLTHRFDLLKAQRQQGYILQGQLYSPWSIDAQVTPVAGLPEMSERERAQVEEFVAHAVKRAIVSGLSKRLSADVPERWLAGVQIGADQGMFLQAADVTQSNDVAMITTPTEFRVEPSNGVVLAGETCDVRLVPPRPNVYWDIQSISVSADDPGVMIKDRGDEGTYLAAPAFSLDGKPSKVLLLAKDEESSEVLASALVTTVPRAVTVNPMIHTCYTHTDLTLTAGSLAGGNLTWTINNFVEGESGSLTPEEGGKRCHYKPGPKGDKNYVIDEVLVQDSKTGDHCTVYVLVVHVESPVKIEARLQEDGSVELEARAYGDLLDDVDWQLPIEGQGSLVDARYEPAEDHKAGFVLIFVSGMDGHRPVNGHLILPWPLTDFPAFTQRLLAPGA
ncbi:hypothetical protein QEM13_004202 [Pseudomonas putida]|nr:hypothetical protein [Pseudomonas putida]